MALSDLMDRASEEALDRALKRYYSHRHDDIVAAKQFIAEEIAAGKVQADRCAYDIVNIVLFSGQDDAYFTVRALALEILRNPARIRTTSTGETLAAALLFGRKAWLGQDTWAYAARRVGADWLEAIVRVERDFGWMAPPIELKASRKRKGKRTGA